MGYLLLVSAAPDVRRTFQYPAAEHMFDPHSRGRRSADRGGGPA